MDTAQAQAQIEAIAKKYGLKAEPGDVAALAGKNSDEDVAGFLAAIDTQSKARTSNVTAPQEQSRSQEVSTPAASDWFASVAPPAAAAPVAPVYTPPPRPAELATPYVAPVYTPPPRPAEIATPYVAPVWGGGDFAAPTKPSALQSPFADPELPEALRSPYADPTGEEVASEPGYKFGLDQGIEARDRSAAAQGSLLSGGQQKRLTRYATDYASTKFGEAVGRKRDARQLASSEYNDTYGRALGTRNQIAGDYNTDVRNAFDQYRQRYQGFLDSAQLGGQARGLNEASYQNDVGNSMNQFGTAAGLGMQARGMNENAYQSDVGNAMNQFGTQYRSYQDTIANTRTASNDFWSQQMDLARNSLTALGLARPPVF